jgi:Ca2+-binding RTX toxin-like protein
MTGGAGDDTYSIDSIADIISENANEGTDTVNAIISYTLGANVENLVLGGTALVNGTGNALANSLTGNAKNNVLSGGDGNDVLLGGFGIGLAGVEVDRLAGGTGADTFILGDATNGRYYDDRSSLSAGKTGYARIEDFTPSQGDKLKLKGAATEYYLGASGVSGVPGIGLYHDTNANGVSSLDELIAILDSAESLTPANTINAAIFL